MTEAASRKRPAGGAPDVSPPAIKRARFWFLLYERLHLEMVLCFWSVLDRVASSSVSSTEDTKATFNSILFKPEQMIPQLTRTAQRDLFRACCTFNKTQATLYSIQRSKTFQRLLQEPHLDIEWAYIIDGHADLPPNMFNALLRQLDVFAKQPPDGTPGCCCWPDPINYSAVQWFALKGSSTQAPWWQRLRSVMTVQAYIFFLKDTSDADFAFLRDKLLYQPSDADVDLIFVSVFQQSYKTTIVDKIFERLLSCTRCHPNKWVPCNFSVSNMIGTKLMAMLAADERFTEINEYDAKCIIRSDNKQIAALFLARGVITNMNLFGMGDVIAHIVLFPSPATDAFYRSKTCQEYIQRPNVITAYANVLADVLGKDEYKQAKVRTHPLLETILLDEYSVPNPACARLRTMLLTLLPTVVPP